MLTESVTLAAASCRLQVEAPVKNVPGLEESVIIQATKYTVTKKAYFCVCSRESPVGGAWSQSLE